jgi:sugar lactone lactonase YvrE
MDRRTGMRRVQTQLALVSLALAIAGVASALAPTAASASSYTISRYAGIVNNTSSGAIPGPALSTPIGFPGGVAVDSSGNVYTTDDSNTSEVYKITPSGTLSIIAGDGSVGYPTVGLATNSDLYEPSGVAVDSAGNVYIADADNGVVEEVTPSGMLSIIAGDGSYGNAVAGPATSTPLGTPTAVAVDSSGNLYIADSSDNQVYKVDPSGNLSIIGGNGTSSGPFGPPGLPAVPGPAIDSPLDGPAGVAVDSSGDVFVSLSNAAEVVEIDPSGNLSVVAGTGTSGQPAEGPATSTDLGTPEGLAVDGAGDLYIADIDWEYVEEVTPDGMLSFAAGNGTQSTPTFGGPGTDSALDAPYGIASDPLGRVYFTDSANYTLDRLVGAAPVNTAAPTLSGTVNPGDTVTATEGAWSNDPVLFSYRWQDCDAAGANCTDINGATSSSYSVSSADAGHTLRVVVTAENSGGDVPAGSAVTAAVPIPVTTTTTTTPTTGSTTVTPPATSTTTPAATGSGDGVSLSAKAAGAGVAVSGLGGLELPLVCPQTSAGCDADGNLTLALGGSTPHATTTLRGSVIARFAGVQIEAGHNHLLSVHLTPAAIRYLQTRGVRRVRVTLTLHNHLSGGPTVTTVQRLWLNIAVLQVACPAASGSLTATSIGGQLTLGMTRAQAHRTGHAHKANYGFERYCLAGGRIRVGYPSDMLIHHLAATQRHRVAGRVMIALTSNRHYSIHGVSAGTKLATAADKLRLGAGTTVGMNTWYLVTTRTGAWVVKAQAGTIHEIGVVDRSLTRTASQRRYLWRHL